MRIVIDPGHGGADPGAVGNGLQEKKITYDIAYRIKKQLSRMKCEVLVIQPSEFNPNSTSKDELAIPAQRANQLKADYFLSVHINAGGGEGFESHVYPSASGKQADKLRNVLHSQVMQYLAKYGVKDRGKRYSNFYVLRQTNMPAVLIECGFIDSAKDATLLKDNTFLEGLSNEIAYGLIIALGLERG
jgi:N-acetylmuramoyl-L-alanine amidase